jgi:uncharacterized membrane protein
VLAAFETAIALSALAGAVALATGLVDLGSEIDERLPFHSPVFAAFALAAIVAVPMTVAGWSAASGRPGSRRSAIAAGALLIGWILVQVGFIHAFSVLQPVMASAGAVVLAAGLFERRAAR